MAREARGLSREKAAALLDPPVASKTLERWEAHDDAQLRQLSLNRLEQLAKLYGVKLATLIGALAA